MIEPNLQAKTTGDNGLPSVEKITKNRDQDYTKIVQGIKKLKKPISKVQSILSKKGIDKKGVKKELAPMYPYNRALTDILENVVKPLYGKEIDMNNPKVGDVKIIKPSIDSSQDTLNELLLTLVDAVNELNGHTPEQTLEEKEELMPCQWENCGGGRYCEKHSLESKVKPEKTLEEKFREYLFEDNPETVSDEAKHLAQIAAEHYSTN